MFFWVCVLVGGHGVWMGVGWGLDAPAHPSATILLPRVTCFPPFFLSFFSFLRPIPYSSPDDSRFWDADDFSFEGDGLTDFAVQTFQRLDEHRGLELRPLVTLVTLLPALNHDGRRSAGSATR